ncbi:hypothetical protein AB0M12_36805 [Nocardia vinacea]|uniref:hypothetical protein n=1 Tax=Nocardia vinacea TaxID=96468 RepID=UPI003432498D
MPEYDRDREDFRNNDRGRIFEDGTERYFPENERNGYKRGLEVPTDQGPRRYDKGKVLRDGRILAVEDKSGRVIGENDIKEFYKDRELLDKGKVDQLLIRTVEGEKISDKAKELIKELQDKFGERVVHQVIPRWQAREIWAMGLEVWKEKQQQKEKQPRQLELIRTYELTRADRARKRLEKIREIVRVRQQAKEREERVRAEREPEKARSRERNKDQAKPPAVARERAEPPSKSKEVREREDAQAREQVNDPALRAAQRELLELGREGRGSQRDDVAREIEPMRGQEPPAPPPVPQRTREQEREIALARAVQERENARAAAIEAGLSREIMGILGLNSNEPPQLREADRSRTQADADRERSIHQQRERERSEREREARHRDD